MEQACAAPAEALTVNFKNCKNRGSCLNGNKGYTRFGEAWSVCKVTTDCAFIMKFTNGKYYLRRSSDTDDPGIPNSGMAFTCSAECKQDADDPSNCFKFSGLTCEEVMDNTDRNHDKRLSWYVTRKDKSDWICNDRLKGSSVKCKDHETTPYHEISKTCTGYAFSPALGKTPEGCKKNAGCIFKIERGTNIVTLQHVWTGNKTGNQPCFRDQGRCNSCSQLAKAGFPKQVCESGAEMSKPIRVDVSKPIPKSKDDESWVNSICIVSVNYPRGLRDPPTKFGKNEQKDPINVTMKCEGKPDLIVLATQELTSLTRFGNQIKPLHNEFKKYYDDAAIPGYERVAKCGGKISAGVIVLVRIEKRSLVHPKQMEFGGNHNGDCIDIKGNDGAWTNVKGTTIGALLGLYAPHKVC